MKYYLLSVSRGVPSINIGDYIQAVAASQYLPQIDGFIDREGLNLYNGEECKVIMNGWYMHYPMNWPPSDKITPLFVSFHINKLVKERMVKNDSVAYFKCHTPIGCRDIETAEILKKEGIEAYFSGCLTLTLGYKYKYTGMRSGVYIVDPIVHFSGRFEKCKWCVLSLKHLKEIKIIYNKYPKYERRKLSMWGLASKLYYVYRRYFSLQTILGATYITHQEKHYLIDYKSDEERLNCALNLIRKYASAKMVITSRIHCALPCLGLGTSVIYLYDDKQDEVSTCRLNGLVQLFNTVHVKGDTFYSKDIKFGEIKINENNCPPNKRLWKEYSEALKLRCFKFIKGQE